MESLHEKLVREARDIVNRLALYAENAERLGCVPYPLRGSVFELHVEGEDAEIGVADHGLVAIGGVDGWHVGHEVIVPGVRYRPDGSGEPDDVDWTPVAERLNAREVPTAIIEMFVAATLDDFDRALAETALAAELEKADRLAEVLAR
jgi:hypothetical protein